MNKKQIKEELRRSACEDDPWVSVSWEALQIVYMFDPDLETRKHPSVSYFFLFVAEAL